MAVTRRVYWDTMIFAYWLEGNKHFASRVQEIHGSMRRRGDILCSSAFVLAELLVGPLKMGKPEQATALERFFSTPEIMMVPFPNSAARLFAELRALENLKPVDALHLSLAAHAGVDLFLTNDKRLHSVKRPGLPYITTLQTDLF